MNDVSREQVLVHGFGPDTQMGDITDDILERLERGGEKLLETGTKMGIKRAEDEVMKLISGNGGGEPPNGGNQGTTPVVYNPPSNTGSNVPDVVGGPQVAPTQSMPINIDTVKDQLRKVPPVYVAGGIGGAAKLLGAGWITSLAIAAGSYLVVNKVIET